MHLTFKVRLITAPVFCFIKTISGTYLNAGISAVNSDSLSGHIT